MSGGASIGRVRRHALPLPLRASRAALASLVILAALVAVLLAVSVRHASDGVDTLFGHPIFSVASGSMTPAIETGDLIVDQPLTSAQVTGLRAGQIISFEVDPLGANAIVVTHRISAVVRGPNGSGLQYQTKGDANNAPDEVLVAPSQIVGLYQSRVPFGGYVLSTLHQPLTFVILIMVPIVYLVIGEVRRRWVLYGEDDRLAREETLAATVAAGATRPDLSPNLTRLEGDGEGRAIG